MNRKTYRIISLSIALAMTFSLLSGCGNHNNIIADARATIADVSLESSAVEENGDMATLENPSDKSEVEDAILEEMDIIENPTAAIEKLEIPANKQTPVNNFVEKSVEETNLSDSSVSTTDVRGMTITQRNSLNMMNFLTVLTQEINDSKGSRLYVENAYTSLLNNTYPNAVDSRTQAQLTNILDTLEGYRMVDVKRERLEYIYEQNRAQAMRQAIPNPMSVLNVVQSKNLLKAVVSVVYMAVDSYTSYSTFTVHTDLQYLQDGWELDDEEATELHNSRKQAFTYMLSMVRDNDLPGDYALNEESVKEFVTWKNNTNVVRRISYLESNISTYEAFGTYWLTLAESYYESGEYRKCLDSINKYEEISSRIFRKDYDYAKVLPLGIIAAKEIYGKQEYLEVAEKYVTAILSNSDNTDWTLSYFVAQIYLDLYAQTNDKSYVEKAYKIAYDNVNYLVDEQKNLNAKYLSDISEVEIPKGATKREKEEIKQYNKMLKAKRKIELPPISEALYLNCDLLFALADELNIASKEKSKIDSILHENDDAIFLMQVIDNRFWLNKSTSLNVDDIDVSFDGEEFIIPAIYMSSNSSIVVTVDDGGNKTVIDDWNIKGVTRNKNTSYTDYSARFTSKTAGKFKYSTGMKITIEITPIEAEPDEKIEFLYEAMGIKKAFIFNNIQFERIKK